MLKALLDKLSLPCSF